jgi:hypothetical protein
MDGNKSTGIETTFTTPTSRTISESMRMKNG